MKTNKQLAENSASYYWRSLVKQDSKEFHTRGLKYLNKIISSTKESLNNVRINGIVLDVWWWPWNKTVHIWNELMDHTKWSILILIEPVEANRKIAIKRMRETWILYDVAKWYWVKVIEGNSYDLAAYWKIEHIFMNQILHHLTDEQKALSIQQAFNSLKVWGRLFILDTMVPNQFFHQVTTFFLLKKLYSYRKKNNYHNSTQQAHIDLIENTSNGNYFFEVELDSTKNFYNLWKMWEIWTKLKILYPFMTQIVAVKKENHENTTKK